MMRRTAWAVWIVAVVVPLVLFLLLWNIFNKSSNDFCSSGDAIYRVFQTYLDDLGDDSSGSPNSTHQFAIEGRNYIVRSTKVSDETMLSYINVVESWPATLEGSSGYIYTSSGNIPTNYWPTVYHTKRMSSTVFCYSEYEFE